MADEDDAGEDRHVHRRLPVPLTPFIGRSQERRALADAVRANRLVTATGPGGVGKTRLALAVAEDLAGELAGGAVFTGLVTVTDPDLVVAAVADAAGVPERAGVSRKDALLATLADRELLVVLDNCEHVADATRTLAADLLGACPAVRILATSRLRLLLPGERVVPVPGLSGGADGDAVELFVARAAAGGASDAALADTDAMVDVCRRLEGMALAIELGASRVPSIGVDGLRGSLAAGLDLSFGSGADTRHRSLRATIDWSYHLLSTSEQLMLRAGAVFAAPFTADAAATVAGVTASDALGHLGRLADWSLVTLVPGARSRYRILEAVRQYAADVSRDTGELADVRANHARWCGRTMAELLGQDATTAAWCEAVDAMVDDARAALTWAVADGRLALASELAEQLAEVVFRRGHPNEAQLRYEQAAAHADGRRRHLMLRRASRAALLRYVGSECLRLLDEAAQLADADGWPEDAALDRADVVIVYARHMGVIANRLTDEHLEQLLARAHDLAGDSPRVAAAIAVARMMSSLGVSGDHRDYAAAAVDQATAWADELVDAALDARCGVEMAADDLPAAHATVQTRLARLAPVPFDVEHGMDHTDAHLMAVHVGIATGRLHEAREHAAVLATFPFLREEHHVGLVRTIEARAFAGHFDDVRTAAAGFERGWREAGRPRVTSHAPAARAVAMTYGILGDDAEHDRWADIARELCLEPALADDPVRIWPALFEGLVALHRGDGAEAWRILSIAPDDPRLMTNSNQAIWRPWYAAAWAEAAAAVEVDDLDAELATAAHVARHNQVAAAIVDRVRAERRGDADALARLAAAFAAMDCPYQAERTRRLVVGAPTPSVPAADEGAPFGLTERELEVLTLVVAGRSNPQIAAALYMSRKTAEHHVSRILAKLGVSTRSEAAGVAARHGLGPR